MSAPALGRGANRQLQRPHAPQPRRLPHEIDDVADQYLTAAIDATP